MILQKGKAIQASAMLYSCCSTFAVVSSVDFPSGLEPNEVVLLDHFLTPEPSRLRR